MRLESHKAATPAKVGVGRAGLRYRTETLLQWLADLAVAKSAVESQVPPGWAEEHGLLPLATLAASPEQFLVRPDLGRQLPPEVADNIRRRCARSPEVQIVVGDGLSAVAVMENAPPMLAVLLDSLRQRGRSVGTPVFVRHCRAKIIDVVGHLVEARTGIILLGERPGLGTGDGMSAYLVWDPRPERTDAEKQAISNIHRRGLPPARAGEHAANVLEAMFVQRTSGVGLDLSGVVIPRVERRRENLVRPEEAGDGCGQSHGQQCELARGGLPGQACQRSVERPCDVATS